jgi:multicomponent Na+:H+ antiporter subunit A
MLLFLAGGERRLRRTEPLVPELFLGIGITLAALTGVTGWLIGDAFLEGGSWSVTVPLLGVAKLTSALAFDLGVYLVVLGLVLALLRSLGREEVQVL